MLCLPGFGMDLALCGASCCLPVLQNCGGPLFVQLVQHNREWRNNRAVCLTREACWEWTCELLWVCGALWDSLWSGSARIATTSAGSRWALAVTHNVPLCWRAEMGTFCFRNVCTGFMLSTYQVPKPKHRNYCLDLLCCSVLNSKSDVAVNWKFVLSNKPCCLTGRNLDLRDIRHECHRVNKTQVSCVDQHWWYAGDVAGLLKSCLQLSFDLGLSKTFSSACFCCSFIYLPRPGWTWRNLL